MANAYSTALAAAQFLDEEYRRRAEWYAGITNNPDTRIFNDHGVDHQLWAYAQCISVEVARDAEQLLLDAGYQRGPGGGNVTSVFVYVYKVTRNTCEDC